MKRVKLIYNPNSGRGLLVDKLDKIIEIYQKNSYFISIHRISNDIDLSLAFEDVDQSFHHILIAGGDGTVNNVINKMKSNNLDIPIAVLPVGTANDFARGIGMPDSIEEGLEQILNSEIKEIDLGKVNDTYFVNILSTGLFTDISHKVDPQLKKNFGRFAYYVRGIQDIYNIKPLDIDVVSKDVEYLEGKYMMFVFNGRTAGRIPLAYKAELDDGLFDVIIIKARGIKKSINTFLKILNGTYLEDEEIVEYFKTDELFIQSDEDIIIDIDGERGPVCPLEINCIKGGMKVFGYK